MVNYGNFSAAPIYNATQYNFQGDWYATPRDRIRERRRGGTPENLDPAPGAAEVWDVPRRLAIVAPSTTTC